MNKLVTVLVSILLIAGVVSLVVYLNRQNSKDNFTVVTPDYVLETVNSGGWNGSAMPWNNCLDANKVYCSQALTRQPGGCLKMRSYPVCGASCNMGCPSACPNCVHGTCQN